MSCSKVESHLPSRYGSGLVSSSVGVPTTALSCCHLDKTMNCCPDFVFAQTFFTVLHIFALSCTAIMCVSPKLPEYLDPKTTAYGNILLHPIH
eukprot:7426673-Ditylum_brightwellii.AAC.1